MEDRNRFGFGSSSRRTQVCTTLGDWSYHANQNDRALKESVSLPIDVVGIIRMTLPRGSGSMELG